MVDTIQSNEVPVFLINGFLEAGKTSFIAYTIGEDYFHVDGTTLLFICEEGEVEYNTKLLRRENTVPILVEDKSVLTREYMAKLGREHRAERVLIEYNGMWGDPGELEWPEGWVLYQQITVMDGTTLGSYLTNMRPLMGPLLRNSELCIVNRCDGLSTDQLMDYKRKLRPMLLKGSMVVMENKFGEIPLDTLPEDLPYDTSGPHIVIEPENYGTWYLDARDYPDRYLGKTVELTARIMKNPRFGPGVFVAGRMAMTCCEADMAFLGYLCRSKSLGAFRDGAWVKLKARFTLQERDEYDGQGPFLEVESMTLTGPINEPAGF